MMHDGGDPAAADSRPLTSIVFVVLAAGLATACGGAAIVLPTRRAPARVTPILATPRMLPATFTPVPSGDVAQAISPLPGPTIPATATAVTEEGTGNIESPPSEMSLQRPGETPFLENPPLSVPCFGKGKLFRSRFPSDVGGPWRDYHGYLPPCYRKEGRELPVLYLFHGSVQTDRHWVDLGLIGLVDERIRNGRYPPFLVIMPFNGKLGNITSGGSGSIEAITVEYLLPYVDEMFCTWSDRAGRNLGGISRGGYWALMMAFRHPELFAAVSGHSSHLRLETDPAPYNPLVSYDGADLGDTRIWLDWGERDFLRAGQQQLHMALLETGTAHEVQVNEGGHSDDYWRRHLSAYLDWHTVVWPRDRAAYPFCG